MTKTKAKTPPSPRAETCPFCSGRMELREAKRGGARMVCMGGGCSYWYAIPNYEPEAKPGPPCPCCGGASAETGIEPNHINGPRTFYRCVGKPVEGRGDKPVSCAWTWSETQYRNPTRRRPAPAGPAGPLDEPWPSGKPEPAVTSK